MGMVSLHIPPIYIYMPVWLGDGKHGKHEILLPTRIMKDSSRPEAALPAAQRLRFAHSSGVRQQLVSGRNRQLRDLEGHLLFHIVLR